MDLNPKEENTQIPEDGKVTDIPVLAPSIAEGVNAVSLTSAQKGYNASACRLAFKLLGKLYDGKSFVFSPVSLQMALSMVVNGAEGETAKEILDVLGYGKDGLEEVNVYGKSLLEQLPAVDGDVSVQMADALFVNDQYPVRPEFQQSMAAYYYAPVTNLPFDKEKEVKEAVNQWCKESTHGLIPEILDKVSSTSMAYILNALYFKASWNLPFNPDYQILARQPFYGEGGSVTVDYLASEEDILYGEGNSFQMASRTFGKKNAFAMAFLLPKSNHGLADVLEECQVKDWAGICASQRSTLSRIKLPKFKTDSSHELNGLLQQLGIRRAFGGNAQFSKMIMDGGACISEVIQKATMTMDEGGVEAAAVTEVEMAATDTGEPGPEPVLFYADHPFAYVIYERASGTILFTGVYDGK